MVMRVAKTTIWTHGLHWVSIMCGQESGVITGYSSIKIGAVCCSCLNEQWSVDVLSLCGCFKLPDWVLLERGLNPIALILSSSWCLGSSFSSSLWPWHDKLVCHIGVKAPAEGELRARSNHIKDHFCIPLSNYILKWCVCGLLFQGVMKVVFL